MNFPDRTNIRVSGESIKSMNKLSSGENNTSYSSDEKGRLFLLSFLSPESQKVSESDVTNYWLNWSHNHNDRSRTSEHSA